MTESKCITQTHECNLYLTMGRRKTKEWNT